jgi:CarD family transcriptional regulator
MGQALFGRIRVEDAGFSFVQVHVTMKKKSSLDFAQADYIVYPKHGVGRILDIEKQTISGMDLELYVIRFEKERMTLRVPTNKAKAVGMRTLASQDTMNEALKTLKGKARIKRTMWSRRAQEYEAKINSGDLISIAEVVRDLHRTSDQPEQSYSERQIYESALARLAREVAAVEAIEETAAVKRLEDMLRAA